MSGPMHIPVDVPPWSVLKVLGDPIRVEIILALKDLREMAAGEIHALFPRRSPAAISQHLKALISAGLISYRSEGAKRIYFNQEITIREAGLFCFHLSGTELIPQAFPGAQA